MALFLKQDFSPPVLSRKWIAMKFRPNMIIHSRYHIISILESGLLFREDSIEVEQETPMAEDIWVAAGGGGSGWMTRGEQMISAAIVTACVYMFPPKSLNKTLIPHVVAYVSLPIAVRCVHRSMCSASLSMLLSRMRDYLTLARRAAACLKESALLTAQLDSVSSVIESTHTLLCRQQSELAILMSRASSAVLGNAPWLRSDVAWEAVSGDNNNNLLKIHHAFLVVQSTLLKHIALAHILPSVKAKRLYRNHNERLYWIHNTLIECISEEFKDNYEALERMYRLLKNCGRVDIDKKPGRVIDNSWAYSEVHTGIARASLELKIAANTCCSLDMFLDSCALNKQKLDLNVLNKDIDNLIENITKCLSTVQNSQIRLMKLNNKFNRDINKVKEEICDDKEEGYLQIEDKEPEVKDEVFYFVKTEDDDLVSRPVDVITAPGKNERDTTKIVLNELKRKLIKREDVMRERERQALLNTMPELEKIPDFPRQINVDEINRKGYLFKLKKKVPAKKRFKTYKIHRPIRKNVKYQLKHDKYVNQSDIQSPCFEAKTKLLTFSKDANKINITKWYKKDQSEKSNIEFSDLSVGLSDVESNSVNKAVNQAVNNLVNGDKTTRNEARNYKFSKQDLELSSSGSDFESYTQHHQLLKDARRNRVARKKNHPSKRPSIDKVDDESLKPMEYSLGTGLAMASVLQVNNVRVFNNMTSEEIFVGDGEMSNDSGNDEDA